MKKLILLGGMALLATAQAATPEVYTKLWRDEKLNAHIERNIEQYRKGDAAITVVDAAGQPVSGAKISVQQTGHEFLFGCNAFVLGQLGDKEQRYEDAFTKLFNFATVPFYWEGTEPTQGELRYEEKGSRDIWRRPPPERFLAWAAKNNITLKGHPMLWHAYLPNWLPKDPDALRALFQKRFKEITSRFGDKLGVVDIVNESQVCPKTFPLYTPDRDYVRWAFKEAAPLFPATTITMINEVTEYNFKPYETNSYVAQIRKLIEQGAQVRGIGLQYHFFRRKALDGYLASAKADPNKLLALYENFSEFNLPLYITEITIASAGEDGAELQAEVVRDHYRLWFAAPNMAGITWWNLGDGTAVKGENEAMGGLLDADFKPKPAFAA
ncbi:MAG: endo-1,4-beta-xylanase, partial [Kiritimatiellaeota bacterium]|nr:endo-1,4-beta-xylanase [Kiritimatiellota bacterium]